MSVCYPVLQIIGGLPGVPTQSVWSKAREVFYISFALFVLVPVFRCGKAYSGSASYYRLKYIELLTNMYLSNMDKLYAYYT